MPDDQHKLLVDTDIGTDIDDAACLAYLLNQPNCDLVGITTVTGEAVKRAKLADALCRVLGAEEVPIHAGTESPLLVPQTQTSAPQGEVLDNWDHKPVLEPNTAVDFMRRAIRKYPGEITLLTIGPLTNVGLLFALDPQVPQLLDRLVMMGGCFNREENETNASTDPHSTEIVYRADIDDLLVVSLDVTLQCSTNPHEAKKIFGAEEHQLIREMAEVWFEKRNHLVFHDPLAAAVIFEPELCTYQSGEAKVELCEEGRVGLTSWTPSEGQEKGHKIATTVDEKAFFSHYREVVGQGNRSD